MPPQKKKKLKKKKKEIFKLRSFAHEEKSTACFWHNLTINIESYIKIKSVLRQKGKQYFGFKSGEQLNLGQILQRLAAFEKSSFACETTMFFFYGQ